MTLSSAGVSRRGALFLAGAAGLAASGSVGLRGAASAVTADEILAAARGYMAARVRSAGPGAGNLARTGMSADVYSFERERAAYIRGLGQQLGWDGVVRSLSSSVDNVSVAEDAASGLVTVTLYETMTLTWIPNERVPDPEYQKLREANPERYDVGKPTGGYLTTSLLGTPHELRLDRSSGRWSVIADTYFERDLFGDSPTAKGAGQVVIDRLASTRRTQVDYRSHQVRGKGSTVARLDPPYDVYGWRAACTYATNYALNYNGNYVHYNCSGGDCANFVSQCFWAGNQLPEGNWDRIKTSSCGATNKWGGAGLPWYNNGNLRNWVIDKGRGGDAAGVGALGKGDIINYDWEPNGDGVDHVAIMTNAASNYVSCHNNDRLNVPWQLGGADNYLFTAMIEHY